MRACPSCGGIVGRDCFNPQECAEISYSQEQSRRHQLDKKVAELEATCEKLKTQRGNLRNELDRLLAVVGKEDYEFITKCLEEN